MMSAEVDCTRIEYSASCDDKQYKSGLFGVVRGGESSVNSAGSIDSLDEQNGISSQVSSDVDNDDKSLPCYPVTSLVTSRDHPTTDGMTTEVDEMNNKLRNMMKTMELMAEHVSRIEAKVAEKIAECERRLNSLRKGNDMIAKCAMLSDITERSVSTPMWPLERYSQVAQPCRGDGVISGSTSRQRKDGGAVVSSPIGAHKPKRSVSGPLEKTVIADGWRALLEKQNMETMPCGKENQSNAFKGCGYHPECVNSVWTNAWESSNAKVVDKQVWNGSNVVETPADIRSVTIARDVKEIRDGAFKEYTNLYEVEFQTGSRVALIGIGAFMNALVKQISIPAGVREICAEAFKGCDSLVTVVFEGNSRLCDIGKRAFGSTGIERIMIPKSVRHMGDRIFWGCKRLELVTFESGSKLDFIGNEAFVCTKMKTIVIPANIKEINEELFKGQRHLEVIKFETGSQTVVIKPGAFMDTKLKAITIPAGIRELSENVFKGCTNLETVLFGEDSQLRVIGKHAFAGTIIKKITIPASVSEITCPFTGCCVREISVSVDNPFFIASGSLLLSRDGKNIVGYGGYNSIVIPRSVETICDAIFKNERSLASVVFESESRLSSIGSEAFMGTNIARMSIPLSCNHIDGSAFAGCNISSFVVDPCSPFFKTQGSLLLNSDGKKIICCFGENVTIPPTVEEIGAKAFCGSSIELLVVPRHVSIIGTDSFKNCARLHTLKLKNRALKGRYVGADFHGLIAHLSRKSDGYVGVSTVSVTAKSTALGKPHHALALFDTWSYHCSKDQPNQWLSIDFKGRTVCPTQYTLRTKDLKSWVIEGSTDGASWTTLDERTDTDCLLGLNRVACFSITTSTSFRFLRVRQTGKNHSDTDVLHLGAVEIFGSLSYM